MKILISFIVCLMAFASHSEACLVVCTDGTHYFTDSGCVNGD